MVDRNKVDDIMEMMKSDPVFEELFSSFGKLQSIMMIHYVYN
jgi:predicted regulator of amino acid metabolism with ACT domain